jgi:hypothetical protein
LTPVNGLRVGWISVGSGVLRVGTLGLPAGWVCRGTRCGVVVVRGLLPVWKVWLIGLTLVKVASLVVRAVGGVAVRGLLPVWRVWLIGLTLVKVGSLVGRVVVVTARKQPPHKPATAPEPLKPANQRAHHPVLPDGGAARS